MVGIVSVCVGGRKVRVTTDFSRNHVLDKQATRFRRGKMYFLKNVSVAAAVLRSFRTRFKFLFAEQLWLGNRLYCGRGKKKTGSVIRKADDLGLLEQLKNRHHLGDSLTNMRPHFEILISNRFAMRIS